MSWYILQDTRGGKSGNMSIQGETNLIEVEVDLHAYLKAAIS